jgi:hypothetical protein
MSESQEVPTRFAGTYFDRDIVLTIAQWALILSWVGGGIYLLTWLASLGQFLVQFTNGLFFAKGMAFFDTLNLFTSYLLQPLQGVIFFFTLQGIGQGLRILMDIEDNTRRAAKQ